LDLLHSVVGASGGVQILGDSESAKRSLTCQLAGRVYPFEACEDRLWEEDLLVGQTVLVVPTARGKVSTWVASRDVAALS
jgi:hypothetical protein